MKTTVVIPNYNGIDYLKNCIGSLNRCVPQDFAVIVVENGSTDGSLEWLRESHPEIKVIANATNLGFAPAVNQGIRASETPYVLLLNNDTEVASDFVDRLEEAIDAVPRAFSVSARMVTMQDHNVIDGAGDYYCALGWAYAYGKGKQADRSCNRPKRVFSACAGAAIYRRDLLLEIGLFDEEHFAYLEDVDLGYRARINGYINLYEPTAVCIHAGSGYSGSRYNRFKVNLSSRNNIYMVLKNMPLLQLIINLPLLLLGYVIKWLFFILKGLGGCYIKGLGKGIALYCSKAGHSHKVRFRWKNLGNYIIIEWELLVNIIRKISGCNF